MRVRSFERNMRDLKHVNPLALIFFAMKEREREEGDWMDMARSNVRGLKMGQQKW